MGILGITFRDKTMDRNPPMKLLLFRPMRSGASQATHVLGFSGIFPW